MVETIDRIDPHLVMVVHSWNNEQFVNFDGPAQAAAERFSALSGLPVKASGEFAATPGSLGSYAGRDRGIPVLTIELLKGSDPKWTGARSTTPSSERSAGTERHRGRSTA